MKNDVPAEVMDLIGRSRSFMITAHKSPDGDAIGSVLAMDMLLRKLGRETFVFLEDGIPDLYAFLPGAERVYTTLEGHYDVAVVLDSENASRVSENIDLTDYADKILNIDHHPTTRQFGDYRYINTLAAAVGEQVYELADKAGISLDREMAQCLYVSILTDTGSFRYSNTTAGTHRIAAEMIELGVDPAAAACLIYERRRPEQLRLTARVIDAMKREDGIAWSVITQQTVADLGLADADLEGAIEMVRSLDGIDAAVMFTERADGRIKSSLRAKGGCNVLEVARKLGGGGHRAAAGFLSDLPLDEVIAATLKALKDYLQASR